MFPTYLFVDPAFWLFSALYAVSVFVVTWLLVLPHRYFSKRPLIGRLPTFVPVLFTILIVYQFFHQAEHVSQMYQFQFLGFTSSQAHGIVWFLDDEWNHFIFNFGYMTGLMILFAQLFKGLDRSETPRTFWMIGAMVAFLLMEGWHMVEHTFRILQHIQGICDQCPGILDPLLGWNRLIYHFWMNFFALVLPAIVYVWYGFPPMVFSWTRKTWTRTINAILA